MGTDSDGDDDPFGDAIAAQTSGHVASAPQAGAGRSSIGDLARAGLTDHEIARALSMRLEDVQASPDVLVPLGEIHDARVARAIYAAAVGGERWEDKIDKFGDVQRVRSQVMPDTRAAAFYLENRQRQEWGGSVKEGVRVVVVRQMPKAIASALAGDAIDAEISEPEPAQPGETPGGLSGRRGRQEREP